MYGEEHVGSVPCGSLLCDLSAGVDKELVVEVPIVDCVGEGGDAALQRDAGANRGTHQLIWHRDHRLDW